MIPKIKKFAIYTIHYILWTPFMVVACACIIYGGFIIIKQIFAWLKNSIWESVPISKLIPPSIVEWINNLEWLGLREIFISITSKLPASVSLIIIGFITLIISTCYITELVRKLEEKWGVEIKKEE